MKNQANSVWFGAVFTIDGFKIACSLSFDFEVYDWRKIGNKNQNWYEGAII